MSKNHYYISYLLCLMVLCTSPHIIAEVTTTGDVSPSNPATWTLSTDAYVGNNTDGSLNIDNGSFINSRTGTISYNSNADGAVSVDGTGSTWNTSSWLSIGDVGTGTLSITDGGIVNCVRGFIGYESNSAGTVYVSGSTSQWNNNGTLFIANYGNGILDISDNASVNNIHAYIGYYAAASGAVTVSSGSTWQSSGELYVGHNGSGVLNIQNGGLVNSGDGNDETISAIGCLAGSNGLVNVDGIGSQWTSTSDIGIGNLGNGTLNVTNGGTVTLGNSNAVLGYDTGSVGHVSIEGVNSSLSANNIVTGYYGTGTVDIKTGGRVTCATDGYLGYMPDSYASISVNGGNSELLIGGILSVGDEGTAILNIANGGSVQTAGKSYIGNYSTGNGTVSIDGTDSSLSSDSSLYVGNSGNGQLYVRNGGTLTNTYGFIGKETGSSGTVTVDGNGSVWEDSQNIEVGYKGNGTLNIINGGRVISGGGSSDICYNGDEATGATGIVLVDGDGSTWINNAHITIGGMGDIGILKICNGGFVSNNFGCIGQFSIATVDGTGSRWENSELWVGWNGGTMNVTNGGTVINSDNGYIGDMDNLTGIANVGGNGSLWANEANLYIGYNEGNGILNLTNHGTVTVAGEAEIKAGSSLSIGISNNDMFTVGGNLTNNGTICLTAGAGLGVGEYTPITVNGEWAGSGTYQTFGGVWNELLHTFTVAEAKQTATGQLTSIDLSTQQRINVDNSLCVNFMPTATQNQLDFTATVTDSEILSALQSMLGDGEFVEGSWDFSITGLPDGNDVMLSFAVLGSPTVADLTIWHFAEETGWSLYSADDIMVSGGWASFRVDSFSSYAVTGTIVPEPTTLTLCLAGLAFFNKSRRSRRAGK